MAGNKLNFFAHWLPGIVLFLKIYSIIGDSLFDIWRNMLVDEIPKGVTNHKYVNQNRFYLIRIFIIEKFIKNIMKLGNSCIEGWRRCLNYE